MAKLKLEKEEEELASVKCNMDVESLENFENKVNINQEKLENISNAPKSQDMQETKPLKIKSD